MGIDDENNHSLVKSKRAPSPVQRKCPLPTKERHRDVTSQDFRSLIFFPKLSPAVFWVCWCVIKAAHDVSGLSSSSVLLTPTPQALSGGYITL